jgi:hypothetical protein
MMITTLTLIATRAVLNSEKLSLRRNSLLSGLKVPRKLKILVKAGLTKPTRKIMTTHLRNARRVSRCDSS